MEEMKVLRVFAIMVLGLVALLGAACSADGSKPSGSDPTATPTATTSPTGIDSGSTGSDELGLNGFDTAEGNFAVLISDEENAIGDFSNLYVDITKVGVQVLGEETEWLEIDVPVENSQVDLTQFTGDDATGLVQANLPDGEYGKIFVYVDDVEGILAATGESVSVKLPSSKLQINQPFTVGGDEVTTFVFDITVIETGNGRYILKPQASESGSNKEYRVRERERGGELDVRGADLDGDGRPDVVTVRDEAGAPVRGADVEIEIELDRLTTDENGDVTFGVPAGAQEMKIKAHAGEAEGALQVKFGEPMEAGEEEEEAQDLTIQVQGELVVGGQATVRVLDAEGNAVVGADVDVKFEVIAGQTGEDGTLNVDVPADGEVDIEARTENARGDAERTEKREEKRRESPSGQVSGKRQPAPVRVCVVGNEECDDRNDRIEEEKGRPVSNDAMCVVGTEVCDDRAVSTTCPTDGVDQDCDGRVCATDGVDEDCDGRIDTDDDNDSIPTATEDQESPSSATGQTGTSTGTAEAARR